MEETRQGMRARLVDVSPNTTIQNRDESVDSLKFTLILFVIFGHCLEVFKLHFSPFTEHLYQFIYLFHMPLFVFISGYYMNKNKDVTRFFRGIVLLLETYLVFQLPSFLLSCIHGFKNPVDILNPIWAMWYIPSLIVWRLIVYLLPDRIANQKVLVVLLSLCLSVLGGLIKYNNFAFQRIVSYFPMFMMGYYFRQSGLFNKLKICSTVFSVVIIIIGFIILFLLNVKTSVLFYQNSSYFSQPVSVKYGMVFRFLWYFVTFLISLMILPLLLRIGNRRFAYYGKSTLLFYVGHVFFLTYYRIVISILNIGDYPLLAFVTFVFITYFLCWLSGTRISKYITNPISTIIKKMNESDK